ncbi:MAG: carbohydrate-binding domain-containing protein [Oscillospiraceae bacterium]
MDNEASCGDESVIINGSDITITAGGSYELTGNLFGCITVQVSKEEEVVLNLNWASVSNDYGSAIYVESADKVKINSMSGTNNYFEDGGSSEACIYSKDDLTLKGDGYINISGNTKNAVYSKNNLKVTGGSLDIWAAGNALVGKDKVIIENGYINISWCKDGIKSTNDTDSSKGYVTVSGGTVYVTAEDDAIQAVTGVEVYGCSIYTNAGGKKVNCDGTVSVEDGCIIKQN